MVNWAKTALPRGGDGRGQRLCSLIMGRGWQDQRLRSLGEVVAEAKTDRNRHGERNFAGQQLTLKPNLISNFCAEPSQGNKRQIYFSVKTRAKFLVEKNHFTCKADKRKFKEASKSFIYVICQLDINFIY